MANRRYADKFKEEAVKQFTSNNYPLKEVASRLGVHPDSLKEWVKIRHSYLGYICPNEFERRYNQGVVEKEALTE